MPKRRAQSLSRKTRAARRVAASRKNESEEERAERLERLRLSDQARRDNENEEERAERLERLRLRDQARRDNENEEKRAKRLERLRLSDQARRDNENEEERAERLERLRLRDQERRDYESEGERAERLERLRLRDQERRDDKNEEERAERLERVRQKKEETRSSRLYINWTRAAFSYDATKNYSSYPEVSIGQMDTEYHRVMDTTTTKCVHDWLKRSYNISVNEDWLSTCIEFIRQETQGSVQKLDLKSLVLEQWLVSDLSEIGEPSLPDEIFTSDKCFLHQDSPLQMISIVDVATPLYGQIQKLQPDGPPTDTDMFTFSDTQFGSANTQTYGNNTKPSRMLKLELTDGHKNVQAIEYQPVKALHTDLPAGTKILIRGSVLCRRQVLLLKEDNVYVMGGEVDDLIVVSNPLLNLQAELERNKQGSTGVGNS